MTGNDNDVNDNGGNSNAADESDDGEGNKGDNDDDDNEDDKVKSDGNDKAGANGNVNMDDTSKNWYVDGNDHHIHARTIIIAIENFLYLSLERCNSSNQNKFLLKSTFRQIQSNPSNQIFSRGYSHAFSVLSRNIVSVLQSGIYLLSGTWQLSNKPVSIHV